MAEETGEELEFSIHAESRDVEPLMASQNHALSFTKA
jgi:hypothetical protein